MIAYGGNKFQLGKKAITAMRQPAIGTTNDAMAKILTIFVYQYSSHYRALDTCSPHGTGIAVEDTALHGSHISDDRLAIYRRRSINVRKHRLLSEARRHAA